MRRVVEAGTASSQEVVAVLQTGMKGRRLGNVATSFAVTDHPHSQETGKDQIRQALRPFTAVQDCAVSDARVAQCFFTLFRQKTRSSIFLTGKTFF